MRKRLLFVLLIVFVIVCLLATSAMASGGEKDAHGQESFWRFPGWQGIFAILAVAFFGSAIKYLPKYIARDEEGGSH